MLDHRLFLSDIENIIFRLKSRGVDDNTILNLQKKINLRKELLQKNDHLRHLNNEANSQIQFLIKDREKNYLDIQEKKELIKNRNIQIKEITDNQKENDLQLNELLLNIPNIPHHSVHQGKNEDDNKVISINSKKISKKNTFDFEPLSHFEIGKILGILDFESAVKMSGSRFVTYRGKGAKLERALINFMLDKAIQNGYEEILPPLLVKYHAMENAAQYPKFFGEAFSTHDNEMHLIPTSEVPLLNLHANEIIDINLLPLRYTAYTPCFRREAGAAGKDTRGLIRLHQFNKVELFSLSHPDKSMNEHERLRNNAEDILQILKLPYRVVELCTGDLSFASQKTYDLEVWLPSQKKYREISSCSNCTDFQARRAKIRFRPNITKEDKKRKPLLLHTLNGSALAVGRTMVAILENYQQKDHSIRIPEALIEYFGDDIITPI